MQALSQLSYTPLGKNDTITYYDYFYYRAAFAPLASPRGFEPRYSP